MDSSSQIGFNQQIPENSRLRPGETRNRGEREEFREPRGDEVTLSTYQKSGKNRKGANGQGRSKKRDHRYEADSRNGKGGAVNENGSMKKTRPSVPTSIPVMPDDNGTPETQQSNGRGSRHGGNHYDLREIADRALQARGLLTDFTAKETKQLDAIREPAKPTDSSIRDMRSMLWCSIDNDNSRDLDQLTVAEKLPNGDVKIYVAIADVDALVPKDSPIDLHAQNNTTSIYTPEKMYPMLPEKLSTDFTSLNPGEDRMSVVTEYTVGPDGLIKDYNLYRAHVHNHAKLAYNSVAAWLDGKGESPKAAADVAGLEDQLRTQYDVAQKLKERRHENGSLTLETIEPKATVVDGKVLDLEVADKNSAMEIIEDFMVASNGCVARFLTDRGFPTLMRVVKTPKRWDRIVQLAAEKGVKLPKEPDSAALEKFMVDQKRKDPLHFPDLSLSVVKSLGRGEYIMQRPGEDPVGHFGLAVKDYAHSTAPNRRYPDLITQRMIKAALEGKPCPYSLDELDALAAQCTEQEANADKAERQANKSAAALYISDKIGQTFEAIVTGAADKGTWVRVLKPPVEGKLVQGQKGVDVGDRIRVTLDSVDVEKGFIDFVRAGRR